VPDREPTRLHRQLAAELAMQRRLSGLSGRDMAKRLGVSQPTVVRIEHAEHAPPSLPVVQAWLDAVNANPESRERATALTEAIHLQTVRWPALLADRTHLQDEVRQRELESVLVQNFQPTVIPGLLQTASYTQALLPLTDISGKLDHAATLAGRLERQQVLYESGRQFQFLITEATLTWSPADNLLDGQLDRIAQLCTLPTVDIAVLPARVQVATPWHNFVIHTVAGDTSSYVTTELIHGIQRLGDGEEVQLYRRLWDRMRNAAITGVDAVQLIRALPR
jgi:transcriptional regulator with XRE-family HTH domain